MWAKGLLLPPPELVKVKREIGKPPIVDIMLDKWLALMENRQAEYEEFRHGVVSALSGGINVPSLLDNPPPRIAKEFGPSPFPGMEFVQMIADGDEWANGLTEEVPEWAEALLPNLRKIARAGKRAGRREHESVCRLRSPEPHQRFRGQAGSCTRSRQ